MKLPPKPLSQILRSTPIIQKVLKLTTSYQAMCWSQLNYANSIYSFVCCQMCSLSTNRKDDWRRIAIFYTFTKIGDKSCKVIVNSESCINLISSMPCENLGLEIVPYPHPFNVSWIDSTANNNFLFQSILVITKTRFGVM